MRIRKAKPEEALALTQLAQEAKRYWGYPEQWIKHWQSDLTISADFISNNEVYVADEDGELRGFYALSVSQHKAELEHLWVTPAHVGTGVGKELFLHAMDQATRENLSQSQRSYSAQSTLVRRNSSPKRS